MHRYKREFYEKILPLAKAAEKKYGLDRTAVVAQAAHESNWGRSNVASYNNWFGIHMFEALGDYKKYDHVSTAAGDYRAYDTLEEGFKDYIDFTYRSPGNYTGCHKLSGIEYIKCLQEGSNRDDIRATGGPYAEDTEYVSKLEDYFEGGIEEEIAAAERELEIEEAPSEVLEDTEEEFEEDPALEARRTSERRPEFGMASEGAGIRAKEEGLGNFNLKSYKFKLLIEGVEIPILSIMSDESDISTFTVSAPPLEKGLELKANSYGLLLYKDKAMYNEWKVLSEGILHVSGYTKAPRRREITLKFKSILWYYQEARVYNILEGNTSDLINKREGLFYGDAAYGDNPGESEREFVTTYRAYTNLIEVLNERVDGEPLFGIVEWFIGRFEVLNKFAINTSEGLELGTNRIEIIENELTAEIMRLPILQSTMVDLFTSANRDTSILDLVLTVAQLAHYEVKPIPGFGNGELSKFVFKPKTELTIPPACNVIFPDEYSRLNFRKDYHQMPTRYQFSDTISGGAFNRFYAPREIGEQLDDTRPDGTPAEGNEVLTEEEKFRGIIPQNDSLPYTDTYGMMEAIDEEEAEERREAFIEYKSQFTDYQYHLNRYRSIPLNLEISFRPGLLPGFPVLILDKDIPLIGYLQNFNHNINIEGGHAMTTVVLSHVRPVSESFPMLAGFYDSELFEPDKITNFYRRFGTESAFERLDNEIVSNILQDGDLNIKEATKELRELYEESIENNKRVQFQNSMKRRMPVFFNEDDNSDTITDRKSINWEPGKNAEFNGSFNNIEIDGTNVSQERRNAAMEYISQINQHGGR